ncbi:MAG: bacterial transcriptional activator domain-containing protein [Anaerolineae bacterium]
MLLASNPLESLRLAGNVLAADPVWEDAWRVEMRAHAARGNRALAIRAWERCVAALDRELGIAPLPETRAVYLSITNRRD